jgi:DNA-binding NarL/FixJ family response regulator
VGSLIETYLSGSGFDVKVCTGAAAARAVADEFDPDLAILDINLGDGMNGVQLGYILERAHPSMAIMYLTRYPSAFLSKSDSAAHVANKVVLNKDAVESPSDLLQAIEAALRGFRSNTPAVVDPGMGQLTSLHWEILQMVAEGLTNAAIAKRRGTSERAVEKQLKSIYQALEVESDELTNARVLAARRYLNATGGASLNSPSS